MKDHLEAIKYDHGISAIDTGLERPGMAACYLVDCGSALAVIDSGINASVPRILDQARAEDRDPEEITHVIVTHVHLDHASGAGGLMQALPAATLVAHPYAARHLVDPSRLEASARSVYGDEYFDKTYGRLLAVDADRVLVRDDEETLQVGERSFVFMDAPGHARHHFTIWDERSSGWFTGDTFGVSYREMIGSEGRMIFPTTTPTQFDPPALIDSIDRMMEQSPEYMYLTHYGRVDDTHRLAEELKASVRFLADLAKQFATVDQRTARIEAAMMEKFLLDARRHGMQGSQDELERLFQMDVVLNTQGIEFMVDHQK